MVLFLFVGRRGILYIARPPRKNAFCRNQKARFARDIHTVLPCYSYFNVSTLPSPGRSRSRSSLAARPHPTKRQVLREEELLVRQDGTTTGHPYKSGKGMTCRVLDNAKRASSMCCEQCKSSRVSQQYSFLPCHQ